MLIKHMSNYAVKWANKLLESAGVKINGENDWDIKNLGQYDVYLAGNKVGGQLCK